MNKQEERYWKELKKMAGFDQEMMEKFVEEDKRSAREFEQKVRANGTHWPENFLRAALDLKSLELKDNVDGKSIDETISELVDKMPSRRATAVRMFFKEEKSLQEVGEELDTVFWNVRVILKQACRYIVLPNRFFRYKNYIVSMERNETEDDDF